MAQRPRAWLLGRLDAVLSEAQRRSPPDELGRYRVLVGATLFLLSLNLVVMLSVPFLPSNAPALGLIALGMSGCYGLILAGVRRSRSPRPASLLVCGLFVGGYMAATFALPLPAVTAHATTMLMPALAVYLVGIRTGLFFTAFFCLNAGLLLPLYMTGFGTRAPLFSNPGSWVAGLLDAFILLLGWGVSALFGAARDAASAAVRERESVLFSLIESTDDPVCSLDSRGRIVTANSAARRMFRAAFGREAKPGDSLDERASAEQRSRWHDDLARALGGQPVRFEVPYLLYERSIVLDVSLHPTVGVDGRVMGVTLFGRDVTERKASEVRLDELHRALREVSRRAGMAEVATGVLHNVGNTLNSVNVSATLVMDRLRGSRAPLLARAVALLREHEAELPAFLWEDARGRQLPEYLSSASSQLVREHEQLLEEMQDLARNVEHIRAVVSLQQENARFGGLVERVPMPELIDDALRLNAASFEKLGIRVQREYTEVPPVLVDRHKLLQILVNLLSNARHALVESGREDKQLVLRVRTVGAERLRIEVGDNGVGIAPEHLPRLFVHGFTTKKGGHGFGLHASALAAEELGGQLGCESGGSGQGATFFIELPLREQEAKEVSA